MNKKEIMSLFTFITEREEIAYKRLKNNPYYLEICERQDNTEEIVEKFYREHFSDEERLKIRRHYEGETEKNGYEVNEVYIQGLRDCFKIIVYLGFLLD